MNRILALLLLVAANIDISAQTNQHVLALGKPATEKETAYSVVYQPETAQYCITLSESKNVYRFLTDTNLNMASGHAQIFNAATKQHYATPKNFGRFEYGNIITKSILYATISTTSGDLCLYIKDLDHFLFTENELNGDDWKISQDLKLAKKERVLSVVQDRNAIYLVTCRFDQNHGFFVYKKQFGQPVETIKFPCNFTTDADNGKPWPVDNNSVQTIFSAFVDYDRSFFEDHILSNGESYPYAWMQDYYKCYFANGRINILVNTAQDASILFALDLHSGKSTNTVFNYGKRSFEKDAVNLPNYAQFQQQGYLNMIVSNQCNLIDSTVVVARRMEEALQLIYYHAYTGKLIKAELFNRNEHWTPGTITSADSVYFPNVRQYEPTLFYNFLKSSRPSVQLELTDSLTVLMRIEVRDENEAYFKRTLQAMAALPPDAFLRNYSGALFRYSRNDIYQDRKVLSFSRQVSRLDFSPQVNHTASPKGLDRDQETKIQAFIQEKKLHVEDLHVRTYAGGADLIYFNRAKGHIELYRF